MKQKWQEKTRCEKILLIAKLVISVLVLCIAALHLLRIWTDGLYIAVSMLGVLQLLEAALTWKRSRGQAVMSLMVAVFIGSILLSVFFL